jgi:hypothetical protein
VFAIGGAVMILRFNFYSREFCNNIEKFKMELYVCYTYVLEFFFGAFFPLYDPVPQISLLKGLSTFSECLICDLNF